jgi:hypothetical protein
MGIGIFLNGSGQELGGVGDAAKVLLYDGAGNPAVLADNAVLPANSGGLAIAGKDYKLARALRATMDGALQIAEETAFLSDVVEGAAVDTNKWIQTTTTMTIAQANGVITLNASSLTTTATGAMLISHRTLPLLRRSPLVASFRARYSATASNTIVEMGFGAPATAIAASIGNGACWRKDGTGQWVPVISINGSEILGTPVSDATVRAAMAVADYAIFWVMLEQTRATFQIVNQSGVLISRQVVPLDGGSAAQGFTVTHLQAMQRVYNSGTAGAAVQLFLSGTDVYAIDGVLNKSWEQQVIGMGSGGSITSPTAFTQLANYANSAAPATGTPSNTAAGYTTLGGQFQMAAPAGAETDLVLFGFQVPTPYQLYVKRVKISAFNMGAAVATTPTLLQWGLGFNSSAVSLATAAPYAPMRKAIGAQAIAVGAAIGTMYGPDCVEWSGFECVQPGRFFHVILKVPVGTATASQLIRGVCSVEGYFE